jgi:hypothetical protein
MKIDLNAVHGLREIGRLMLQPPVNPITNRVAATLGSISLRQLQARHRFAPGQPLSFREIAKRWRANEGSRVISVLSYNTFLMNIEANVFETLDELLPGDGFFEGLVGALAGLAIGGVPGIIGGALTGMTVHAAREALEEFEVVLLKVKHQTPDTVPRAAEIGAMLVREKFDLAALSEVWAEVERKLVQRGIAAAGGVIRGVAQGTLPDIDENHGGCGLMTIGLGVDVGEHQFFPFPKDHRGAANQDSDFYARKGVLLTRIPIGFGEIDLYSTHFYYGGGLPSTPVTSEPTPEQRRNWRTLQLADLKQIIQGTHKPQNVMILVGDFNIDAHRQRDLLGYEHLTAVTKELDLDDTWPLQFPGGKVAHGGTSCGQPEGTDDCVTSSQTNPDEQPRIDYLFVERPTGMHTFNLDVTRIELLDFPRAGDFASLSDHRGLAYSLLCSPKA